MVLTKKNPTTPVYPDRVVDYLIALFNCYILDIALSHVPKFLHVITAIAGTYQMFKVCCS